MLFAKFMPTRWSVYSNDGACDEFVDSPVRKLPYALVTVFLALAHLGLAWLSYLLLSGGPQITPVFFEAGLDLVAILLYGPRYWPVLFAAYLGNSLWRHLGWTPALVVALAGLFRTLLSAWLFRRLAGMKKSLREFAELVALGVSATVAPCLAAGLGTPLLILAGRFPASRGALIFSQWCIADSLGILTLVPVLIAGARLCTKDRPEFDKLQVFKLLLYACGVSLVCYIIFFRPLASTFLFLVFVLILIGAAWLGPTAARASAFIVAAACMWATHAGTGGFVGGTLWENLQNLDLFLAAIALTGMAVGTFRATGSFLLPSGVLLAGWALSGWLYASLDRDRVSYDEARLDKVITSIETRIDSHFKTYEDVLSGAAGMLATSKRISPKDWHTYVSHLHLLERYPSVASISVIQAVSHKELNDFVQAHRRGEWPEFAVRPLYWVAATPAPSLEHFLVVCAEPATVAARAIGGDAVGDPVRRVAAEQSRDSGKAVLTKSTILGVAGERGYSYFFPFTKRASR